MRLLSFRDELDLPTAGVVDGETVIPVARLVEAGGLERELAYLDLGGLLEADPGLEGIRAATDGARAAGERGRPIAGLRPAAAIPRPGKIVCIGLNYRDHVAEQQVETPTRPLLFSKFANAVIADGEPIVRPRGTLALDLEAELGVVIGRTARRVRAADAMAHVAGYVVIDDVTARDWQGNRAALAPGERGDGQWLRAKGSDSFCPMSPVLVTADEIADPHDLRILSWRIPGTGPAAGQAVAMQDGTTADMVFDIPALIEFVSAVITLDPGDVISTGTPAGVGVFREPPVFLEPGDRVRCEVPGVGRVENPVIEWSDPAGESAEGAGRA
jgi:2-keto-4-pentenoate hydratase/2-oxohepta-3-ene-1,7-dioic acid hydratase in catechol pathway